MYQINKKIENNEANIYTAEEFKKLISSNIIDAEICDEQGSEGDGHDAVNQLEDRGVEQNG